MVIKLMPYKVKTYGISDIGQVRQNNEDFWAKLSDINFFALADGMGGHRAGEVAAQEAVKALCDHFQQTLQIAGPHLSIEEAHGLIQLAVEHANTVVYDLNQENSDLRGMGTTLCCIYCHANGLVYAHVGDSRIYRYSNGMLQQMTKDHSLLCELVDMGKINANQANDFLYKNIITKAVGTESQVEPSVHVCDADDGDVFMMCSDGLSDMLSTKEIESILKTHQDIETASKVLIDEANKKGGHDNVTVVILKVNYEKDLS
jgi:protein phosphatase